MQILGEENGGIKNGTTEETALQNSFRPRLAIRQGAHDAVRDTSRYVIIGGIALTAAYFMTTKAQRNRIMKRFLGG